MKCEDIIKRYIGKLEGDFKCLVEDNYVRLITPYRYPDNDNVEIYVQEYSGRFYVTDLGETLRHLASQGFDVFATPKRKYLFETVLSNSDIEFVNGQLIKKVSEEELGSALFELITTSAAIGDFIFTSTSYEPPTFIEEVQDFLSLKQIGYKRKAWYKGKTGKNYQLDFELFNHKKTFLDTLSPKAKRGIKARVDSIFRKWYDIKQSDPNIQKLTLLNDIDFDFREPDIVLLEGVSTIIPWSEKEIILEFVPPKN
jgi:hypothetical protein